MSDPTYLVRVFDAGYEVLRDPPFIRPIGLDGPAPVHAEAIRLGRSLENEPMTDVRLEVWSLDGRTLLRHYTGPVEP